MRQRSYIAMKTDTMASEVLSSDFKELGQVAKKLANHAIKLGGFGFGTSFLAWVASFAAIYLLILDRTNWRTKILTALLVPYIFLTLPSIIFNLFRGEFGKWIAFVAVVLRMFFPDRVPSSLEMPGALILILVVSPSLLADTIRNDWIGVAICLAIGCYLLQEHIRASGGFRNSFTKSHGVSNSVGIILLLAYPVWSLVLILL
ncbi:cold-regulated 413 plasma membrane protein 2 [Heracleum sosnowskyi]|uniref:Cold-regulated 413 plasma membrane protein 2 n=1 Tax=Heracleum sosnowskyi TaxID=360622 RepID=A0AAD8JF89_9APIA|nr:cold-regulated 413 plasma membrane protein 2 [Heracleum sosnowskyi]